MIAFVGGIQKSGTVWLFNMINAAAIASGWNNIYDLRKDNQALDGLFKKRFAAIGPLTETKVDVLRSCHGQGHVFLVHTHMAPNQLINKMLDDEMCKIVYSFRDLRDVAISAFDHGRKNRSKGIYRPFGWIINYELGILYARRLGKKWEAWQSKSKEMPDSVLMCKYEQLLTDPLQTIQDICNFLHISLTHAQLTKILADFSAETVKKDTALQNQLHFNKGVPHRYHDEFNERHLIVAKVLLGKYLLKMGFSG